MKIPNLRWLIAFALFLAAALNYFDRSVLGLLAPTIQRDLHINDTQYATLVDYFMVAYIIAYLASGRVVDWLGVRLSLALFIVWWSISNALTGVADSMRSLSVYRFMLGLGEAGAFTVAPKAVSEWFPASERGVAVGFYSMGGAVGATVAPIAVGEIAARWGWRWVFALSPVMVLLWLMFWLSIYKPRARHPLLTEKERVYLETNIVIKDETSSLPDPSPWQKVLRSPTVWTLMLARMLTDPVLYFYQFWMPKYLHTARGLNQGDLSIMWMFFFAADLGFLAGGFLSGHIIKRGSPAPLSRLSIMLASAFLVPLSVFIPASPQIAEVMALGMIVVFAQTCWLGNLSSLIVDLIPRPILGTAFGVIACGGVVGGILMNGAVSWLITYRSYYECYYMMALVHPVALALVWRFRMHPVAL